MTGGLQGQVNSALPERLWKGRYHREKEGSMSSKNGNMRIETIRWSNRGGEERSSLWEVHAIPGCYSGI